MTFGSSRFTIILRMYAGLLPGEECKLQTLQHR